MGGAARPARTPDAGAGRPAWARAASLPSVSAAARWRCATWSSTSRSRGGSSSSAGSAPSSAVDGVSFEVQRGETLGIVGETGCGKSTTARLIMRLLDATAGEVASTGGTSPACRARALKAVRREMQMIFQDPYSSLNPRKTVGSIIGEPFVIHGLREGQGERKRAVQALMETRRAEPRALQPLPARVLRRPAPAHRRRARARAEPKLLDRRRAGLGAGRLDPGAGPQPAARPAARLRPDARVHRARPVGRAPHVRPGRGHVSRQDRRDRRRTRSSTTSRATPTPARCCRPCRSPIPPRHGERAPLLSGDVPSPANPPSACRFHTRCPKARSCCSVEEPLLEDKGSGTWPPATYPLTREEVAAIGRTICAMSTTRIAGAAEAEELLGALIRFNTVNPPGNERAAQEYLAAHLTRRGLRVRAARRRARAPQPGRAAARARQRRADAVLSRPRRHGARRPGRVDATTRGRAS